MVGMRKGTKKKGTVRVNVNIGARLYNQCRCWKPTIITYSECMLVALVIEHAKRMRRIILSSVACPALPYYSTVFTTARFSKNVSKDKMFVLIFSTAFVWKISHSYKNSASYHVRYSLFSQILIKLEFSLDFRKISNFTEIRPVEAELFHANGHTDRQTWQTSCLYRASMIIKTLYYSTDTQIYNP